MSEDFLVKAAEVLKNIHGEREQESPDLAFVREFRSSMPRPESKVDELLWLMCHTLRQNRIVLAAFTYHRYCMMVKIREPEKIAEQFLAALGKSRTMEVSPL